MNIPIKLRRGTAAAWTAANPILGSGEIGLETDVYPYKFKIGDGTTAWNSLGYMTSGGGVAVSAGTNSTSTSTVVFSNSNGVSFGMNTNAVITATVKTDYLTAQSSNAFSAGAASSTFQTLSFQDSNGISFSNNAGAIRLTHGLQFTSATSAITSNALNTSASRVINIVAATNNTGGGTASLSSNVSFSNANSVTFYTSAGGAVVASFSQSNQAFSAQGGSSAFQTLIFTNSNGFSFSNTGGSIWGSYTVPTVTNSSLSLTADNGSSIGSLSQLYFKNTNGISFGLSTSNNGSATLTASVNAAGNTSWTVSDNVTSATVGRLAFTQANGITMTLSTSNNGNHTVFASHNGITTGALSSQTLAFSLSGNTATTNSSQILNGGYALAGGNGVTLQQSNNTVSISVATNYQSTGNYLTTADLSQNSSKYFQNWKLSGNTAGTTSSAQGTDFWLAGGNGVTLSGSSNTISFSVATNYQSTGNYLTTADLSQNSSKYVQNWKLTGNTAGTTSSAQGTDLWFSGGNSITVSGSSNSIVFSVGNYITTARASTDAIGLNTAKTNVTWTVNSSGLSLDAGGYAGTGFTSAGANITMGGTLNTAGLSLSLSVAPPGAAAENNWHNLLGANTSGNTTASGSTIGLSGINLTLSGTNNSQINISAPATSSISGTGQVSVSVNASTISIGVPVMSMNYWDNGQGLNPSMSSVTVSSNSTFNVFTKGTAQNTVHIFPIGTLQGSIAPNTMFLQMAHSATGNSSSGPKVFTISFGVYTMNASTLSLLNSATTAVSLAANANNSTGYSGTRWISFHSSLWSFAPTFFNDVEYWGAMVYSTGGNNSAAQTAGFLGFYPYQTIAGSGVFGVSQTTGSSQGPYPWLGVHSVSSAIPTSINMADITRQGASANFVPFIVLNNLTSYF